VPQLNDLYLIDQAEPLQISRSHCEIEHTNGCLSHAIAAARRDERRAGCNNGITRRGQCSSGRRDGPRPRRARGRRSDRAGRDDSPYVFRFQVESRAGSKTFENRLVVVLEADSFRTFNRTCLSA
jgi:hypothetical protein